MGRFWLRPVWVVGHVVCLVLILVFLRLGFWQLDRLESKQVRRELRTARLEAPPAPLDEALATGDADYRRVTVSGTWQPEDTWFVRNRTQDGRPGWFVLTLLAVAQDRLLLVNRGFAPLGGGGEEAARRAVAAESVRVEVEGILRPPEQTKGTPTDGMLLDKVDVSRIQASRPAARVEPLALQLTAPAPPPGGFPELLPLPATDLGPHRAYAVQWFTFAAVGAVGWPLLLRKTARDERTGTA